MGYPRRLMQIRLPVGGNLDHWGQEICSRIPAVWEAPVAIMVCDERCRSVRGQGAFWPTRNPIDSSTESDPCGRAASGGSHQPRSWEATSDESSPRPVEPDKSVTVFIGLPDGSTAVATAEGHETLGDVRQQLRAALVFRGVSGSSLPTAALSERPPPFENWISVGEGSCNLLTSE